MFQQTSQMNTTYSLNNFYNSFRIWRYNPKNVRTNVRKNVRKKIARTNVRKISFITVFHNRIWRHNSKNQYTNTTQV